MNFNRIKSGLTFKQLEKIGWDEKAGDYDGLTGAITKEAAPALLAAARVKPGCKVLDIACGPGYIAGLATELGARATGVDFAPGMITTAKERFPHTEFLQDDAEALRFADNTFDAAVCAFGLLHFADPDTAIREAFRVLRPGGRYVFTVWSDRATHEFFNLVLTAVETYGSPNVSPPEAPPIFRFSEQSECKRVLSANGFEKIEVRQLTLHWETANPRDLIRLLEKSSIRMAMILNSQPQETLEKILSAILDAAHRFKHNRHYRINWPAEMAVAIKP